MSCPVPSSCDSGDDVGPVCFSVLVMLKMDWVLSSSQFL